MGLLIIGDEPEPSVNFLRAVMEAAPAAIVIFDAQHRTVLWNPSFRRMWEVPDDYNGSDQGQLIRHLNSRIQDGPSFSIDDSPPGSGPSVFKLTGGRWLVGRCWQAAGDDEPACTIWQFNEVAEGFLLTDARLQDFAELASDYFWETGTDGRFTFVSGQYREITGVSREDVLGKTREEIWTRYGQPDKPANKHYVEESARFVAQHEAYSDIRIEWQRPDGRDLILSMSGKPITNEAGDFAGYRGIARDITGAARHEEALQDSEKRLRELLDASPVGVSIVNKKTARRVYVNQAFADMMGGGRRGDLVGGDANDTWADITDRQRFMEILNGGDDIRNFEHSRRRLDGTLVWTLMNSREVEFGGAAAYIFWFVDITARRETERLVRESEQRLRQILDDSPVAVSVLSISDFQRRFANKAFLNMIGADTMNQALSLDARDTWASQARYDELQEIVSGDGDLNDFQGIRQRMDGTEFPCSVTSRNMWFAGQPSRVYWAVDLTERWKAEKAVRQSEERLRTIIESSPSGFAVVSRATNRRMFVNRTTLKMFGFDDLDEFLGVPIAESWAEPKRLVDFREAIRTDDVVNFDAQRIKRDGTAFWALMSSRNIDFEDEPARIIWMTDITERVATEENIRRSEQKLREILETSPLGISVVSQETFDRLFANRAMANLLGAASPEDVVAENIADSWINENSQSEARKVLNSSDGFVNFEARRKRLDGNHFWCLQNSSRIEFEGEQAWVVWHNDITDIKAQQQSVLHAKEEADKANLAKSEFLSSMSHELRTPLNAILGFAQLLKMTPDVPLTDNQSGNVDQIMRGGRHLLGLIDQVLDLAKIESGQLDLNIAPVTLETALTECRDLVRSTAERRGITLHIDDTCIEEDLTVIADPTRLRQVILNLLSNAIKYNRDGGGVTVSCRRTDGAMMRISVADTGPGIPRDRWPAVFEPFSRLGAETTEIEGTGIGLTLSKQLAENMGGRIGFTSEVEVGSTFWITVPTAIVDEPETGDNEATDIDAAPELTTTTEGVVLYVEDNPANLQLVELIFDHLDGLRLISAPTGEAGVELAQRHRPDVVLMDIRLPGIDGYEALRRIRANPKTEDIPVIALSADAMPENIIQGKAAGFVDYLTKPLNVGRLVEMINSAMLEASDNDDT